MAKVLRQNVGGIDFTVAGCSLTGSSDTAAADYEKIVTLSDGDVIEDGMTLVVTFENGNSAGNAPVAKTIYSSDQETYYEDDQLTIPFTLAPAGCYDIEYTGTGNAYSYVSYPVIVAGSVRGPVCDYRGKLTSGNLWQAGDEVQCMYKQGKFMLLGGAGDSIKVYDTYQDLLDDLPNLPVGTKWMTKEGGAGVTNQVEKGDFRLVTSNAVADSLSYSTTEQKTGGTWIDGKPIYRKVIDCGALPNNSDKYINTNIANIGYVISIKGTATSGGVYFLPLPFTAKATDISIQLGVTHEVDKIHFSTNFDLSAYTQSYIILEYTKTTD